MIPFVRGPAPPELIAYRKTPAAEGAGTGRWDEAPQEVLDAIRERLFQVQRGLCCYCGRRLDIGSEGRTHIEHIEPRSDKKVDPFEWTNLALSCDGGNADGATPHCDHAKGSQKLDYVDPFARPTFAVTKLVSSGSLRVVREAAVRDVEEVLVLNAKSLVARRDKAVRALVESMPAKSWSVATCERAARELEQASRAPDFLPWLVTWLRTRGGI